MQGKCPSLSRFDVMSRLIGQLLSTYGVDWAMPLIMSSISPQHCLMAVGEEVA